VLHETGNVDSLPDSLDAVVSAELDNLAPFPRRVLRYASVLGGSFRPVVFDEVLAAVRLEVDAASRDALDEFFVQDGADRVRFRTALLRDVAYETLPYRRRRELHRVAGDVIERLAGNDPSGVADALALHFAHANDHRRAWRYARDAGDRAKRSYANVEAAAQYERALESARRLAAVAKDDRARVWTSLGDVRVQAGLFGEAFDAYRHASQLVAGEPSVGAELRLKRARARERAGEYAMALRETAAAVRMIESLDTPDAAMTRARLTAFRAVVRQAQERPREARALADRAAATAQAACEREAEARAYGVLDWAYQQLGQPERAVYAEKALAIYEELGDLDGQARITGNLGALAYLAGRWDEARPYYERAHGAFRKTGNEVDAAMTAANLGELLVGQARFAEAEPLLREASRVLRASGFVDGATFAEIQICRLLLEQHDLDGAERLLSAINADLATLGLVGSEFEAALYNAQCRTLRADPSGALELLDRAERAAGSDALIYTASCARVRAGALIALGRFDDARDALDVGLDDARRQGNVYDEALLLLARADVARAVGREPDADDVTRAHALLAGLGVLSGGTSGRPRRRSSR
jgi:tetratricopeptide (TPR) repeat protein